MVFPPIGNLNCLKTLDCLPSHLEYLQFTDTVLPTLDIN